MLLDTLPWLAVSIDIAMILTAIYFNILFIHNYIFIIKKKMNSSLFWVVEMFSFFAILSMITFIPRFIFYGDNMAPIVRIFMVASYGNQMPLFVAVLMTRLYFMFKGTIHQLSRMTIIIVVAINIIMYCSVPTLIVSFKKSSIYFSIIAGIFAAATLLNISICLLFVKKVYEVNKNVDKKTRNRLIDVITRSCILAVTQCTFSSLVAVSSGIQIRYIKYQKSAIPPCFLLMDTFISYMCIILSFKQFKSKYHCICGCVDAKCKSICERITVSVKVAENLEMSTTSV